MTVGAYADELDRLRRELYAEVEAREAWPAQPMQPLTDFQCGFRAGVAACLAVLPAGGLWDDLRGRLADLVPVDQRRLAE